MYVPAELIFDTEFPAALTIETMVVVKYAKSMGASVMSAIFGFVVCVTDKVLFRRAYS